MGDKLGTATKQFTVRTRETISVNEKKMEEKNPNLHHSRKTLQTD